jgi:hypothetical protein
MHRPHSLESDSIRCVSVAAGWSSSQVCSGSVPLSHVQMVCCAQEAAQAPSLKAPPPEVAPARLAAPAGVQGRHASDHTGPSTTRALALPTDYCQTAAAIPASTCHQHVWGSCVHFHFVRRMQRVPVYASIAWTRRLLPWGNIDRACRAATTPATYSNADAES